VTWRQRYWLRDAVRSSLWIVPMTALALAMPFSVAVRALDEATRWRLLAAEPDSLGVGGQASVRL
jgi:hypothetical protein